VRAEAFEELFERHFDAIYAYLARRVGPDLGRDLASETFTRAFAARKRYDALRGEERPWLFGIANNLLRRHYRDEERRLRAFARLDVRRDDVSPDEPLLADALAALSRGERDVLLLFGWADLSYEEIAAMNLLTCSTCANSNHQSRGALQAGRPSPAPVFRNVPRADGWPHSPPGRCHVGRSAARCVLDSFGNRLRIGLEDVFSSH
jgi:RNA polymerase sigma factor (sigma-70 family)